jgi:hypothetical protein
MHNAGGVMVRFADGAAGGDEVGLEVQVSAAQASLCWPPKPPYVGRLRLHRTRYAEVGDLHGRRWCFPDGPELLVARAHQLRQSACCTKP